jgi:endogenous inhibitor of DNA gyrase (YacG/DUF329 family)
MIIPLKKADKCPICSRKIVRPNSWVRFHIKYQPEMVILACKYCNLIEKDMRCGTPVHFLKRNPYRPNRLSRAELVISYMQKFGVTY